MAGESLSVTYPRKHTRTSCKSAMGFYSNTLSTLAFNSDCSRALLSASGKINDCPSGKKKAFGTHIPQGQKNGGGKKNSLNPVGEFQPSETPT